MKRRKQNMRKQRRAWMAMAMAVAMVTATISSVVPENGITVEAASVRLSKNSLNLKVGQSQQLTVKGTKKTVKWSVSNGKIVKVTKKGKVTAKKEGTAKVFAKVKGKKLTCNVKVTAASSKKTTMSPSSSPASKGNTGSSTGSNGNTNSGTTQGTGTPAVTNKPIVTTGPAITPTATNTAKVTEEPTKTNKPGKTEVPEESEAPKKTGEPKETANPEGNNLEIKVGETKSNTVDGVEFTYMAWEDGIFVKMENTNKSAKFVYVAVDKFDLEGNKINVDATLCNESIEYLSAGKTYVGYIDKFSLKEVSKYAVNRVEVKETNYACKDCTREIKVESKYEADMSYMNVTLEYTGDSSIMGNSGITVYGAIVYYDSENNIIAVNSINQEMYVFEGNTITFKEMLSEEPGRYEVLLSGANYISFADTTEEPRETDEPQETPSAEPTEKPTEVSKEEKSEFKMGQTKTVTVEGIKFTYTSQKEMLVLKMENTTKAAKSINVLVNILDSQGKVLSDGSYEYKAGTSYLSAGKTYCEVVRYYCKEEEIASFEIEYLEIENQNFYFTDCLKNVSVSPECGKYVEGDIITLKYAGDVENFPGKSVTVHGYIVYYDSEDNIVDIGCFANKIIPSENSEGTVEIFSFGDGEARYEVFLSGAKYMGSLYAS